MLTSALSGDLGYDSVAFSLDGAETYLSVDVNYNYNYDMQDALFALRDAILNGICVPFEKPYVLYDGIFYADITEYLGLYDMRVVSVAFTGEDNWVTLRRDDYYYESSAEAGEICIWPVYMIEMMDAVYYDYRDGYDIYRPDFSDMIFIPIDDEHTIAVFDERTLEFILERLS
jgi:hypothetical protein